MRRAFVGFGIFLAVVLIVVLAYALYSYGRQGEGDSTISISNQSPIDYSLLSNRLMNSPYCFWKSDREIFPAERLAAFRALSTIEKRLTTGWEVLQICIDPANPNLYLVAATTEVDFSEIPSSVKEMTKKLFSSMYIEPTQSGDLYRLYQIYLFADDYSIINVNSKVLTYRNGDLILVGDRIIWYQGLAGCSLESGNFAKDGGFIVSCGGGDNGCFDEERVRFTLYDDMKQRLGRCSKNCDLLAGEPRTITCTAPTD